MVFLQATSFPTMSHLQVGSKLQRQKMKMPPPSSPALNSNTNSLRGMISHGTSFPVQGRDISIYYPSRAVLEMQMFRAMGSSQRCSWPNSLLLPSDNDTRRAGPSSQCCCFAQRMANIWGVLRQPRGAPVAPEARSPSWIGTGWGPCRVESSAA